jgi:hypothetical protein
VRRVHSLCATGGRQHRQSNLTTTNIPGLSWSYKSATNVVTVDAGTMASMFAGLCIQLDSGDGQSQMLLAGSKTGLFGGTVIGQKPNLFKQYP